MRFRNFHINGNADSTCCKIDRGGIHGLLSSFVSIRAEDGQPCVHRSARAHSWKSIVPPPPVSLDHETFKFARRSREKKGEGEKKKIGEIRGWTRWLERKFWRGRFLRLRLDRGIWFRNSFVLVYDRAFFFLGR